MKKDEFRINTKRMRKIIKCVGICIVLCVVLIIWMRINDMPREEKNFKSKVDSIPLEKNEMQNIEELINKLDSANLWQDESLLYEEGTTLETRILTPEGYKRENVKEGTFDDFIRTYPLREHASNVMLYDGSKKGNQSAHVAIFDMDLSTRDLQQCADSIIRMYAEYFYSTEQTDKIKFHFVDGFLCEYTKWRDGYRVQFQDNNTKWVKSREYDDSYEIFQKYLDMVFAYASTLSLEEESDTIDIESLEVGDIWLRSGSPGHVVMVVDVCENEEGEKAFLLAQGYMPAQQFHILKNPQSENNPWYYEKDISYPFYTPEYSFQEGQLKRLFYD